MAATLTMVPLAKIKPREGFNPRTEFGDEQMAELVASVKQHGIITPLTLTPDGDGFVIVAGERRFRAAKQARLKEVPAQVRDADGDALTLAVVENVIRGLDARLERIVVTDLKDRTFYAKLILRRNGKTVEVDSRPSDAIAVAVLMKVPIYVEERVLEDVVADPTTEGPDLAPDEDDED